MKLETQIKIREIKYKMVDAIAYILIGILFCILKSSVINWLLTIVGVVFIVMGIYDIVKNKTNSGVITLVIGLVIILGGWLFVEVVLIVFGVLLFVKGILELISALSTKLDIIQIVNSSVTTVIGVMLIISKWALLDWFFIVLGIIFIVDGILVFFRKEVEIK